MSESMSKFPAHFINLVEKPGSMRQKSTKGIEEEGGEERRRKTEAKSSERRLKR
jgi:hypothetical protein